MIEYKLLYETSSPKLDTTVNGYLKNGWELYGCPFISSDYRYQAVIKRDTPVVKTDPVPIYNAVEVPDHTI